MSLVEVGFEVHRGLVAGSAVEPLTVAEDFQPLEDRRLGFGARGELTPMHQLALQAVPEALDHGVIVTTTGVTSLLPVFDLSSSLTNPSAETKKGSRITAYS